MSDLNSNQQHLIIDFLANFSITADQINFKLEAKKLQISVELDESSRGIFIGHHAQTLDAFQLVLALMINNQLAPDDRFIVTLDMGGYRQDRYRRIIEQAEILAQEALEQKLAKSMPQLSPTERRQIHLYFQDNEQITTYSQGEGENRRLFIAPAAA